MVAYVQPPAAEVVTNVTHSKADFVTVSKLRGNG